MSKATEVAKAKSEFHAADAAFKKTSHRAYARVGRARRKLMALGYMPRDTNTTRIVKIGSAKK